MITLKKFSVEPLLTQPYLTSVCSLNCSMLSIDDCIRRTVKNAAKLAVYEEININEKNDHKMQISLTDGDGLVLTRVP